MPLLPTLSPAEPEGRYGNLDGKTNETTDCGKCLEKCDVPIGA